MFTIAIALKKSLVLSALLALFCTEALAASIPPPVSRATAGSSERENGLSPTARDIAEQLGIIPLLLKVEQYGAMAELDTKGEIDRLKLKQTLSMKVAVATLQVRDATARIERELAYINRLSGVLEDRRDKAIKLNSIENVVASGGISEIGNSRSFAANQVTNNVLQLVAGGATIGLGSWALKQQSGGAHRLPAKPNMLAEVFNIQTDADSKYPDFVWTYLNRAPVGGTKTRLQAMLERWQQFKVIPRNINTPEGRRRVAVLTNTIPNGKANIEVFADRSDMLVDLRSEIFQIDRDLLDLMTCLQEAYQ
ncbi:MAG: hypothetical protein K2W95_14950 [Candidatus Obscuribacterales bacterium]|nr:hypothetical protein [Candidatus Obscuribacterales bacterium]